MPWKETGVMDQKIEFVIRSFSKTETFRDLCREYGITPKTGYKWKERFLQDGIEGLQERSRKPRSNVKQIAESIVCEIVRIKNARKNWGPRKVHRVYANSHPGENIPSLSTVERILKKSGMIVPRRKRRRGTDQRIQNRIKPNEPNQLWTVDFKGWWYTKFQERCEPLTVRDEFSKYILDIRILEKADISSVKREFVRLFREYGLPKVIRSDNGPPFANATAMLGLTKLAAWWMSLGIQLDRIDPASPHQNGAHERMHLDMKKELEGKISGNLNMHQKIFDVWRHEYNSERPHEALGMQTPDSLYKKSERKYREFDEIVYPEGFISRHINDRGYFNFHARRIFVSNAFNGFEIGILDNKDTVLKVYFCEQYIGTLDTETYVFQPKSA